jgi:hypothetical protein
MEFWQGFVKKSGNELPRRTMNAEPRVENTDLDLRAMYSSWDTQPGEDSASTVLGDGIQLLPRSLFDRNPGIDLPPSRGKLGSSEACV